MKKWIPILVVMIGVGIYFAWPKTQIKEPIVMSVQFDEAAKTLTVSYIVAKDDHTYVMQIAHDTQGFYPPRSSGNWDGKTDYTQVLATQNGYELREDTVELTDIQLDYFQSFEHGTLPVDISFENYSPIQTILILLLEDDAARAVKTEDKLRYTFTAPEDVTIENIGHFDTAATISFEDTALPLTLSKGQSTDIFIHGAYQRSSHDKMLLQIEIANGKSFTYHFPMTEPIPEGYLRQMVKETNL